MDKIRVFVALDFSGQSECEAFLETIAPHKEVKIGMELFFRLGPDYVRQLTRRGYHVFLDLKCHDIPRTVGRAVAAVRDLGVELLTVHAAGGLEMLDEARKSEGTMGLVAVTVLTSLDGETLRQVGVDSTVEELVDSRTRLAQAAGIEGVVASGLEAHHIRHIWPGARIVVPGIRLPDDASFDQRRVMGPDAAVRQGATDLVVGRPILDAEQPRQALARFLHAVEEAQGGEQPSGQRI